MADDDKDTSKSGIVKEAKERFKRAVEANQDSRKQSIADTQFAWGDADNSAQWPDDVRQSRIADKRVCMTINHVAQHCNQIINSIRQQRPTGKVVPAGNGADKKTSDIFGGLIRSIQAASNADDAHDTAAEHAIYGGFGFWRILTEFKDQSSFEQIIRIKPIANPHLVLIDPNASILEPEKAEWGFIFEDVPKETFKREHPGIDPKDWEIDSDKWVSEETFRRAEYFYVNYVDDVALLLADGTTHLWSKLEKDGVIRTGMVLTHAESGDTAKIIKERKTQRKEWKWCKLVGGHDEPIEVTDWLGDYLPIVQTVGKQVNIDGEIITKGETRDLKDQQRMINYAFSETVQTLALQNKIPYMAASEAIEGYEDEWADANTSNAAYLPFNAYDDNGNPLPRPERQQPPVMASAQVQLLQLANEQMRAASGQQNANFGIKSEAVSGIGINRLKQAGEIATFHFPDNHARGLRYEIKILVDLIPKIYDTKQIVTLLNLDGTNQTAVLDPDAPQAYTENTLNSGDVELIFNPNHGKYDVAIDTGASYMTQRQEGAQALNELAGRNPGLMQVAGDLIMRQQDFPGADVLADRLAKALPPNLQEQKGGADQQLAQTSSQLQQAAQHIQMLEQQMAQMQQALQQAESGQAKSQLEIQGKMQLAQIDAQISEAKTKHEIEMKQHALLLEEQFKREMAELNAHLETEKAAKERELKVTLAKLEIESKEEIAELNAYIELQKANKENVNLTNEVNNELTDDKE